MSGTVLYANNATSSLAAPITSSAVTASLAPGTGVDFPTPGVGQYFVLTFTDAATQQIREIVHVTGLAGDTITAMSRGQESTSAISWLAGDYAQMLITAGLLNNITVSNLAGLITSDPHVAGAPYWNGDTLCKSAG